MVNQWQDHNGDQGQGDSSSSSNPEAFDNQADNENDSSSSRSGSNDSDSSDDSSYDSDIDREAQRLYAALHGAEDAAAAAPPPQQVWHEYCETLASGNATALKVTDKLVHWITQLEQEQERITWTESVVMDLLRVIPTMPVIQHVILGRTILSLLSFAQQAQLFQVIVTASVTNISFWKLGSDDSTSPCGIAMGPLLDCLTGTTTTTTSIPWNCLTEVEMRGLTLETASDVNKILQFVQQCPNLRQCNLLGMQLSHELEQTAGLWNDLVTTVQAMPQFDELQLTVTPRRHYNTDGPPLVDTTTLQHMLHVKPKWWRLALDGLALRDAHVSVLASALRASANCKMNDVLSVRDNPSITATGLQQLYTVCCNKQRMGLVLSDNDAWVATMDLVRPLNNLHRRLEYKDSTSGQYRSRQAWAEWLAVVANLPWIEDARKVNYLWFTLLEQPGLIHASAVPLE